jgi:hypothetical protein
MKMEVKTKYGPFELDGERLLTAVERELSRALVPVVEEAVKIQTDDLLICFYKGKDPQIHISWSDEEFKDVSLFEIVKSEVDDENDYPQEDEEWKETAKRLRKIADYIEAKVKRS